LDLGLDDDFLENIIPIKEILNEDEEDLDFFQRNLNL
jgi:hypothetical protein